MGIRTLDVVHATLERLGYAGDRFGVAGIGPVSFAIYRSASAGVTVMWAGECDICQLSAGTLAAARLLCEALERAGLICERSALRIDVHGQEHVDAEVRKMIG